MLVTTMNISLPEETKEKLDNMLLEGLASGETVEVTDEWWQEKHKRLKFLTTKQRRKEV